jgi:hypothetical protein
VVEASVIPAAPATEATGVPVSTGTGVAAADEQAAAINAAPSATPANDNGREMGRMMLVSPEIA